MAIGIKTQKDCLITEVEISLPTDLNALDMLMKTSRATGDIIASYNQGGVMCVHVKQKSRIPEKDSGKVREIIGVGSKELDCE